MNDWEQRKLGEVANIVGGGTPSTNNSEYWNGNIDWYSPAEIGDQIFVKESQKRISELGLKKVQQEYCLRELYCSLLVPVLGTQLF